MHTDCSRKKRIKYFIFFLIVLNIVIPLLLVGLQGNTQSNVNENYYNEKTPKTQSFSKGDYEPILDTEKQGLGDINITNIDFDEIGFNSSQTKADLKADLTSGALNMTHEGTEFIKTIKVAQVDNINENITDYRKITILLNESINVVYNASIDPLEGYLIYAPKLTPFLDAQLWVENNTPVTLVDKQYYSFDKNDDINFLKFNYKDYFMYNVLNFTMHIIWEYNLKINSWKLTQYEVDDLLIEEEDQVLSPEFKYEFTIVGLKYKYDNQTKKYVELPADNLFINLTVNFPDKVLLMNHKIQINSENFGSNILNADKSLSRLVLANNTKFLIDFTVSYIIGFVEPVDETWGIDRLVEGKDIRERIYFPQIISGPNHIYVKYVNIFEDTIGFEQVESETSLFGRKISYVEVNVTEFEEDITNSLIFNENATKRQGIKITLPYLIKGEVCPFTFKYETDRDLRVIITDNIRMPIVGLDVVVFYFGEKYGTYISKEVNQPIGPTITDQNGEILVENVPNGNYTIKIYDPITEELIFEAEVSAFTDINYVLTPIVHFPLIILIFSISSLSIFGIGYKIFKKQKKNTSK